MPEEFKTRKEFASLWIASNLKEQKCLLELLVNIYYEKVACTGENALSILTVLMKHGLGNDQPNRSYFESESNDIHQRIVHNCTVLAIEVLNFEDLMSNETLNSNPDSLSSSPALLQKTYELIWGQTENLYYYGEPSSFGVVCMAWVFQNNSRLVTVYGSN
jgi:hypothetical protein